MYGNGVRTNGMITTKAHRPMVLPGKDGQNVASVLRGGSWFDYPDYVRASVRGNYHPGNRRYDFGFRVLCSLPIE